MTTALQMITRSMRLAGAIGKGESLDADEAADGLYALNSFMDALSIERLMVYQVLDEAFNLVAGTASYTIGSSGAFNTTRPSKLVDTCFLRLNNIDYPLEIIDEAAYAAIPDKTIQSLPDQIFYEPSYPLATIYFNRKPDQAYSFHCKSWKQLQSFSALTTDLALPPGYQRMIEYGFAEDYGNEFLDGVPPNVSRIAAKLKSKLKTINLPTTIMSVETLSNRSVQNINVG